MFSTAFRRAWSSLRLVAQYYHDDIPNQTEEKPVPVRRSRSRFLNEILHLSEM